MRRSITWWPVLVVTSAVIAGCTADGSGTLTETWAAVDAPPDGLRCVHVLSGDVEQRFDITGTQSVLLHLDQLPAVRTLNAVAFATSCDAVARGGDAVPDWISDPVAVAVHDGGRGAGALAFHRNGDHGRHHCPGDGAGMPGAGDDPPRLEQVRYHGSGCPAGSVTVGFSVDHQAATVTYSAYSASAGPGIDASEHHKRCNLDFLVHVPQGKSFAVSTINYRGFVHLESAMTAVLKTRVGLKGSKYQDRDVQRFAGPVDQDYLMHDEAGFATLVWSPCGGLRTLDVDSAIAVDNAQNPTGTALLTVDLLDHEVAQTYHLAWKTCP